MAKNRPTDDCKCTGCDCFYDEGIAVCSHCPCCEDKDCSELN